jgi:hypothetical protein
MAPPWINRIKYNLSCHHLESVRPVQLSLLPNYILILDPCSPHFLLFLSGLVTSPKVSKQYSFDTILIKVQFVSHSLELQNYNFENLFEPSHLHVCHILLGLKNIISIPPPSEFEHFLILEKYNGFSLKSYIVHLEHLSRKWNNLAIPFLWGLV